MNKRIIIALVSLYALTWVGGWVTHSRQIKSEARQLYAGAEKRDCEMAERFQKEGLDPHGISGHLSKSGPTAGVAWCVPLLPGVVLADSWYVIGPRWGKGGVKIVLYYGFGTKELVCLWGWVS